MHILSFQYSCHCFLIPGCNYVKKSRRSTNLSLNPSSRHRKRLPKPKYKLIFPPTDGAMYTVTKPQTKCFGTPSSAYRYRKRPGTISPYISLQSPRVWPTVRIALMLERIQSILKIHLLDTYY